MFCIISFVRFATRIDLGSTGVHPGVVLSVRFTPIRIRLHVVNKRTKVINIGPHDHICTYGSKNKFVIICFQSIKCRRSKNFQLKTKHSRRKPVEKAVSFASMHEHIIVRTRGMHKFTITSHIFDQCVWSSEYFHPSDFSYALANFYVTKSDY